MSRPTLDRCLEQLETTGRVAPKPRVPPPQPAKIQDWKKFKEFVDLHGDQTQNWTGDRYG